VPPYLAARGLDIRSPSTMALVAQEIARQAQMQAFDDLFWFIGWVTFAILPLLFMMKRPERTGVVIA
jgi:MFS transporter, DHA2 family, multidrug resistance protein